MRMKTASNNRKRVRGLSRAVLACACALALIVCPVYGQVGSGTVNFLWIEPDARSGGLAGAGSTILDGGYGGYFNPALLGWQRGTIAGFSYSNWLPGFGNEYRYNHVTGGVELSPRSSLAANLTYLSLGEQLATDANNVILGSFTSHQLAAGLSYGRLAGRHFSWGVGGKYIQSNLASGQFVDGQEISPAGSVALDAGFLFRSSRWSVGSSSGEVRFGSSISNVGPGLQYLDSQSKAALPQIFRSGLAIEFIPDASEMHSLTVMADATKSLSRMEQTVTGADTTWSSMAPLRSLVSGWGSVERFNGQQMVSLGPLEQFGLGTGLEYWYNNLFAVRAGYYLEHEDNGARRFATLGTGLRYGPVEVDFSYLIATQEDHPLDGTLRFSLKLHFSKGGYQAPRQVAQRSVSRHQQADLFESAYVETAAEEPEEEILKTDNLLETQALEPAVTVQNVKTETEVLIEEQLNRINVELTGFDSMSSRLSYRQREAVARALILLKTYPELTIHITGHADNNGPTVLNQMLSEARARAIYLELMKYNLIDADRFSVEGLSNLRLLSTEATEEGRRLNRRAELSIPAQLNQSDRVLAVQDLNRIEFKSSVAGPINTGDEIEFDWLDITNKEQASIWLHSMAHYLEENAGSRLFLTHIVNSDRLRIASMQELQKARSELMKSLLISLGVKSSRVVILEPSDPIYIRNRDLFLSDTPSEKTWFFIRN